MFDASQIVFVGADPTNYEHGTQARQVLVLVMHEMEGSLASTDQWFNHQHANPSSAHYGVGKAGEIHQYVQDWDVAYSNGKVLHPNLAAVPWLGTYKGNPNQITLSIEMEGHHTWVDGKVGGTVAAPWVPTEVQYGAVLDLAKYLTARHGIKIDRSHITRHSDYDSINKNWCPGSGWPHGRFIQDLQPTARETLYVDVAAALALPIVVKTAPKISPAVFAQVLTERKSPVANQAQALYDVMVQHYIDPSVGLAFFGRESTFGTDPNNLYINTLNWGNLVADQSRGDLALAQTYPFAGHQFRMYANAIVGLEDWCRLWDKPIYQNKTLRQQLAIYDHEPNGSSKPDAYADYIEQVVGAWRDRSSSFIYLGAL